MAMKREREREIAARNGRHKPPPNGFPHIYIYNYIMIRLAVITCNYQIYSNFENLPMTSAFLKRWGPKTYAVMAWD
jgi:hypothetical protein